MLTGYFYWWYSAGLQQAWQVVNAVLEEAADFFSLGILLRTWFAPWKNDVLSAHNAALSDQVKLWEQNLVSRFVGFFIRSVITFIGAVCLTIVAAASALGLLLWAMVPALIFLLPLTAVWVLVR